MPNAAPKVFISHAGPDQNRFVTPFATRLMENGVEAWYSKWEIKAGDSLVDKIFEEGLKDASAFIIVVSENSIDRPWVRQELNAALVNRINGLCKIIPVVLDGCEVPLALQSTVWVPISNLENYDASFRQIIDSIFEFSERPTLGSPPAYIQASTASIVGLKRQDVLVLKALCEHGGQRSGMWAEMEKVGVTLADEGIDDDMFMESLSILGDEGYITEPRSHRPHYPVMVTDLGFDLYAVAFMPNYEEIKRQVAGLIINRNLTSTEQLVSAGVELPEAVVERILHHFDEQGFSLFCAKRDAVFSRRAATD